MQYLILPDDTRLPISNVTVNKDVTEFTIATPPSTLAGCYVFDDDNGTNDIAHAIMPTNLSGGISGGTANATRIRAILTGQTKKVTS